MKLDKLYLNSINSIKIINQKFSNINKSIASMKVNRFIKDLETSIGKKFLHDAIIMEGFVDIVNGDTVIHGKNSVVDNGLVAIINWLGTNKVYYYMGGWGYYAGSYGWAGSPPSYNSYMIIGSDTSVGTTNGTQGLTSPITSLTNITRPNTQSGSVSAPGIGQWQVQWTSTWSANTIPSNTTLGEVGLYLNINTSLQSFEADGIGAGAALFSRMSSKDGKFTAFTINNTVPLSIAWNFRLTYST